MKTPVIPYKNWMPAELQEMYPSLGGALSGLEGDLGTGNSLPAATVLYWKTCFESTTSADEERLRTLEECLRPSPDPDAEPDTEPAMVYLLVASSSALVQVRGNRYSEATEEVIQRAFRAIRQFQPSRIDPSTSCDEAVEFTVYSAFLTAAGLLHYIRARFLIIENRSEDALAEFEQAFAWWDKIALVGDNETPSYVPEECLTCSECPKFGGQACIDVLDMPDDCFLEFWMEDDFLPGTIAAIFHWLRDNILDLREIADTFNDLTPTTTRVASWRVIERLCASLGATRWYVIRDRQVRGDRLTAADQEEWLSDLSLYWMEFWSHARGIALSRMSRNDYVELREFDKKAESEGRLKAYFFQDSWEELNPEVRDCLISADLAYRQGGGRREKLTDDLRLACEPILRKLLFDRYREWLSKLDVRLDSRWGDPTLGQMIRMIWDPPRARQFDDFLSSLPLDSADTEFIRKALPLALRRLNEQRIQAAHPPNHPLRRAVPVSQNEVTMTFKSFLGIGCEGIIPRLLSIDKKLQIPN